MPDHEEILHTLKEYFGYDSFRPLQQEIIDAVLSKQDNLVIMPTGGGKSICYQLPALLLPGITLVISPLIALMKDQVDGLKANGIQANYLNSSQAETEHQQIYDALLKQEIKLLYIAPESLSFLTPIFDQLNISLIAIDEAHCISSWGHDFRPAYTQLGYLKKKFPSTPLIALTATADKATREDICQQLSIPHATKHISSFDRQNLSLEVRPGTKRIEQMLNFLRTKEQESGIVYCLSRKTTEMLAEKLQEKGFDAQPYHAGLDHQKRAKIQDDFINDNLQIVCATIAFGMGIDKSNVRWVIHYNLPKNIEGYYQEIGRAGRDGLPSETLLFHSFADVVQLRQFADSSGNKDVQLAKLDRMKQYADALSCRRKILLSYFGELIEEDCGNCDVCKNPPKFIDGTVLAQKALSCIARLQQNEPIGTVIDVLRGAQNATVLDKSYDQVKTYGIGKDVSWQDWQQYMIQFINQGLIEIAFHEHNKLKLTELSKKVLYDQEKVTLAHLSELEKKKKEAAIQQKAIKEDTLFERLRTLRLSIAKEAGIPAYQIFNDATLKEMEKDKPVTEEAFMQINGVGRQKLNNYGYQFIKTIAEFTQKETKPKKRKTSAKKGNTHKETLKLHNQGVSLEEIAATRKLAPSTVFSHLIKLHEQGESVNLSNLIDFADLQSVKKAKEELNDPDTLKAYFEYFNEAIDYNTIKIALAILKSN